LPPLEQHYQTPAGYYDLPFMYVFDAGALVDATSPQGLSVQVRGDADFILRRIVGLNLVAQSMIYRNASQSPAMSALTRMRRNYTVVPEKFYPASSEIRFDLGVVLRAFTACGAQPIFLSFLGFQGVRRVPNPAQINPWASAYRYYERPYQYQRDILVDWRRYVALPGQVERPRTFSVEIRDFDFELYAISMVNSPAGTQIAATDFQIQLFGPGQGELMTAPINHEFVNHTGPAANLQQFASVFPVPPVLYPVGSEIQFDIVSLICNTDPTFPRTYSFMFQGVQRVPC
jgi:hypothetical protein